ncbi:hypothetical protein Tco_0351758 [Tanacetum coccineum]
MKFMLRIGRAHSETFYDYDDEVTLVETHSGSESSDKATSFAKILTQPDANNGGGFVVLGMQDWPHFTTDARQLELLSRI